MKRNQTLAAALADVATVVGGLESKADTILAIVKASGIRDLKAFNEAARAAYVENGWSSARGRPAKGAAKATVAPTTVKQYVSRIRAAFRLGVPVASCKTFHALKVALRKAAPAPVVENADKRLAGIRLVRSDSLIGAPFHDLTVIYEKCNRQQQSTIAREVRELVAKFRPSAQPQLVLAKAA